MYNRGLSKSGGSCFDTQIERAEPGPSFLTSYYPTLAGVSFFLSSVMCDPTSKNATLSEILYIFYAI